MTDESAAEVYDVERIEALLRFEWWGNHGHAYPALYGDDGEMACGQCPADFKREPIDVLHKRVIAGRLARAAEARRET